MSDFMHAYDTRTGDRVWVPVHWLDHPVLGEHLSQTPARPVRETKAAPAASKAPAAGDTEKE